MRNTAPLLVLLGALLSLPGVSSRVLFGRVMGPNCTTRVQQRECITNPMFMEKDCEEECKHVQLQDVDHRSCMRRARMCFGRGDAFDNFVFNQCPKTCHDHYKRLERILAPDDLELLIHHIVPMVYSIALAILLCYQLLTQASNYLMMRLEEFKKTSFPGASAIADRGQAVLLYICENQDNMKGMGPHAIGRLYVCGYYIIEAGLIISLMAVVVYLGPRLRLDRTHPKLLQAGYSLLTFYTSCEALFTIIKDLIIHKIAMKPELQQAQGPMEHHQPIYVEGEMTCKKLAMLGVTMLFIQSSTVMPERKRKDLISGMLEDEELPQLEEGLLLGGRLLMAGLFCFVGFVETTRIVGGELHDPPDGHDLLWPKMVQLLLVVPFTLGFKTTVCTQLLAMSLVLEAVTVWMFWNEMYTDMPTLFHAIHSRDHFATNIAVAGGLFLLQKEGGGKYTLDAYMKKKD